MSRLQTLFTIFALLLLCGCNNNNDNDGPSTQTLPAASSNTDLASLTLSEGTLAPAFNPATTAYTTEVDNSVASITISVSTDDTNATADTAGSGTSSTTVPLAQGDNPVAIEVTAQDGSTRTYNLIVTRLPPALSDNADLASLSISAGSLTPLFQSSQFDYSAAVGFPAASTTVTATTDDTDATLTINGAAAVSGTASAAIALSEGMNSIDVVVTAADATTTKTYTITITRASATAFAQSAYLKSSSSPGNFFGRKLTIDGNTIAVGVEWEDSDTSGINSTNPDPSNNAAINAGAVYVFVQDGAGVWTLQAYIKASNPEGVDFFGASVALDGDTLAVGAYGEDSAATGLDGDQTDNSLDAAGAVYIFVRTGDTWTQQAYLKASNPDASDNFGQRVALDGDTLLVSAPYESSAATGVNGDQTDNTATGAGAAYVFTRTAGVWSQQAYLKASNAEAADEFGQGVAVEGDTLAVAAGREKSAATGINGDQADNSANGSGAVYVFTRTATDWTQQAYIKSSNTATGDVFGGSSLLGNALQLSGNTLAVGSYGEDSAASGVGGDQSDNSVRDSGAVYVFTQNAGVWTQQAYIKASNPGLDDWFGSTIGLDGDMLVAGAQNEASAATGLNGDQTDDSAAVAGAAYLFQRTGGVWAQTAYIKGSNTESPDQFGSRVDVSQGKVVVGAQQEASLATGIGGDDSDNSWPGSGAVYVFE